MARITHVAKAQQRYETVVVLNDDGTPKKTPVMRTITDRESSSTGETKRQVQKTTKKGKPVFMTVTEVDRTKPKGPYTCDSCKKPIEVGTPYKHISPKSGPYGGRKLTRHESCPTWHVWEYSSSLSARLAQISFDFWNELESVDNPDDVSSALGSAAEQIRELAEEKREGASNIEEGFGHETSQSAELNETADALEGWADEIESADVSDLPEPEEDECPECQGTGEVEVEADPERGEILLEDATEECSECSGSGTYTPDEPTEEQIEQWRQDLQDELTIVDESPV